jgi:DUF2934 family protein
MYESQEPASEERGANSPAPIKPSPLEVAERAYFLYVDSGCFHGHDLEHWFRAEQDLMLGKPRTRFHGSHN